jgi:hypothetical protein
MMRTTYSTMFLVIGFLALMLMLPSAHINAGPIDNPNGSLASSISNVNQTDLKGLNQSESPLLMAQATEEHRSSESSSSTAISTTEAPPEHCVSHCRHHYEERLKECNDPGHEHHLHCEEWAREREQECLNTCK